MTIIVPHKVDQAHLIKVVDDMRQLGAPTIRAIWLDYADSWVALEGTHRLNAAKKIGITPTIQEVSYDDVCDMDITDKSLGLDIDMPGTTIEQYCDMCVRDSNIINF